MEVNDLGNKYVGMDSSMLMEMAHSKHASENQKVAAVSQQFESVLVKQFLKEALKPMFKGVFNEDGNAHRLYRHFLQMQFLRVLQVVEALGFPISSNNNCLRFLPKITNLNESIIIYLNHVSLRTSHC